MVSQEKLIKQGIKYTDALFKEIENRINKQVRSTDTLESFLDKYHKAFPEHKDNPLIALGYNEKMIDLILQETNNHKFSRPSQKELVRVTIENYVGDLIVDVGEDIKNSVRDIVKHGYNNNLSQDEIAEQITHKVNIIKTKRARAIARTEVARTATISDYVINKERGATHFYVECRNTACPVCKKAWHTGWAEENDSNFTPSDSSAGGKGWMGDRTYSMNDVKKLPPIHVNCRCIPYFIKKEESGSDGVYHSNTNSFKRIGNVDYDEEKVDPKKEFNNISKNGFIKYEDKAGDTHSVKVKCKESSIVTFGDENEIGKKFYDEECYEYQILDKNGKEKVTIYKSKSHKQFSMSDLISVYDNLNNILISECNEIILSCQDVDGRSGGFVLESDPHRITITGITGAFSMGPVLIHEMAHTFDFSNDFISKLEEYINLVHKYPTKENPHTEEDDHYFEEDFAYTVELMVMYPEYFREHGNGKTEYLNNLLGNIIDKEK